MRFQSVIFMPSTVRLKRSASGVLRSASNVLSSAFNVLHSASNVQRSTFQAARSALNKRKHSGTWLSLRIILVLGITSFQTGTTAIQATLKKPSAGNLILHFKATVDGQPFRLHKNYITPFGETFKLDMFKFYAGKITASYKGKPIKKTFSVSDYHLIDFDDSSGTSISLSVPESTYDKILFQLGIDSADQTSGAQTGALDPLKGMFWTWNSGYLGLKMEGISPQSHEPAHAFSYHIGGYRLPNNTVWTIELGMPNDQVIQVNKDGIITLDILIELDHFFDGSTPIRIRDIPACTMPGEPASKIFENFAGAFAGIEFPEKP